MNISEVTETVVRQIIKSGRDVKVVVHDNNDQYFGRWVEISGFATEGETLTAKDATTEDVFIACDYCKYSGLFEDEYPCSKCKHNALNYFERRTDEKTD